VQLRLIGGEDHEHGLANGLRDLVELERCDGERAVREVALEAAVALAAGLFITAGIGTQVCSR
jgi:hypothetical protein